MKSLICTAAVACLIAAPVWAHSDHGHKDSNHDAKHVVTASGALKVDAHTAQDIERHRGMAHAHEQAAQCLASGAPYDDCQKQLQANCKGLALGKNCGMRHSH